MPCRNKVPPDFGLKFLALYEAEAQEDEAVPARFGSSLENKPGSSDIYATSKNSRRIDAAGLPRPGRLLN
jgi:hypothetical protein